MRRNARIYLYIGVGAIAIAILSACLISVINNSRGMNEQENNRTEQENMQQTDTNDKVVQENGGEDIKDVLDAPIDNKPIMDANQGDLDYMPAKPEDFKPGEQEDEQDEPEDSVGATAKTYTFHAGSILQWPVKGNVIMNFSMDKMIYFETLDAYKYHPAICIAAQEGTKVVAGATGEVISITNEPDTGLTVGMRIGSEYIIYYGQLKECNLKIGDHVNRGQAFATVAAPTKYFTVEGSHLYLRLERSEEPVNPLSYLEYSE